MRGHVALCKERRSWLHVSYPRNERQNNQGKDAAGRSLGSRDPFQLLNPCRRCNAERASRWINAKHSFLSTTYARRPRIHMRAHFYVSASGALQTRPGAMGLPWPCFVQLATEPVCRRLETC
ncbi:hypothetical protein CSUI_000659, partial [Cystoisospora suis]